MKDRYVSVRPDSSTTASAYSADYMNQSKGHLRSSHYRQQNLEQYAKYITSESDLEVTVSEAARTASVSKYGDEGTTKITIPVFEGIDVTNPYEVDDEVFYSILMYAEVDHECGHYNFTDMPAFERNFDRVIDAIMGSDEFHSHSAQAEAKKLCKDIWNVIEDGAMEEAVIRSRGPMSQKRLQVKNATFIAQGDEQAPDSIRQNVTFDHALHLASKDHAKYDTGDLRRLLDEDDDTWQFAPGQKDVFAQIYPPLQQTIEQCFVTRDNAERTRVIFDFLIDDVLPIFAEQLQDPTQNTQERDNLRYRQTDDSENDVGPAKSPAPLPQNQESENSTQRAQTPPQPHPQSSPDSTGQQDDPSPDSETDGQSPQTPDQDQAVSCPSCGESDTSRLIQQVPGMVAARASVPFDLSAEWVEAITFISNDELCGFRVTANSIPDQATIEQATHKMQVTHKANSDTNGAQHTIEVLEPKADYDKYESVNGFTCNMCAHSWVPVISGDQ